MYKYPKAINDLTESLKALPGVGKKTAQRYALAIMNNFNNNDIEELIHNLHEVKDSVTTCPFCGIYMDTGSKCPICDDDSRDKTKLFITDTVLDVIALENLNKYDGLYFVLNGNIIYNRDVVSVNIDKLLQYIKVNEIKEIILGNNATIEGETTALYLKELLKDYQNIKVTRLAYGLPVGQDLEFADELTLLRALEGRNQVK